MEEKVLTLYDVEQMKLKELAEAKDPETILKLTESVVQIHSAQVDESVKIGQLDNDVQRVETDKKKLKNDILNTIIGGLITAAGIIGGHWIGERTKGIWNDIFQEHGYAHDKTETVIYNYKKHRP